MPHDHHPHDGEHQHDDHHGHPHAHAHDSHRGHHHPPGQPHQPQPAGPSLLRLSALARMGTAAAAIVMLWAGVWLAMR